MDLPRVGWGPGTQQPPRGVSRVGSCFLWVSLQPGLQLPGTATAQPPLASGGLAESHLSADPS